MTTIDAVPFISAMQKFSSVKEETEMLEKYDGHLTLIKIFFNPATTAIKRLLETSSVTKKTNVRYLTLKDENNTVLATAIFINNLLLNLNKLPQEPLVFDGDKVNDLPLNIFQIRPLGNSLDWFPSQSNICLYNSQTTYPNVILNIGTLILLDGAKLHKVESDTSAGQALMKKYEGQLDTHSTQEEMHQKLKPLIGATFINAKPLLFYHKRRGDLKDVAFFVNNLLVDLSKLPEPLLVFEKDKVNLMPLEDFTVMPSDNVFKG